MGLALLKEDFDDLLAPPPSLDWGKAAAAVDDLKAFERLVDEFDRETTRWLVDMRRRIDDGFSGITDHAKDISQPDLQDTLLPLMEGVIDQIDSTILSHGEPFHERPTIKVSFDQLKQVPGPAGRFIRRQMNRIEDLRVKRYNALVDMHYALLAFRSEIEQDGSAGEAFTDPAALGDFLRKQVA